MAYALTFFHVPRRTPAALRFGGSAALRIWVNGRRVHSRGGFVEPVFDQDEAAVHLEAGWNAVLVKLVRGDTPWGLFLRCTALDGRPLPGLRALLPGEALPESRTPRVASASGDVAPGPYAWWSLQADVPPPRPEKTRFAGELTRVLTAWGRHLPLDRQPQALLAAATPEGHDPQTLLTFAEAEPAIHRKASTLYRLLATAPGHVGGSLALIRLELERQRFLRARMLLDALPEPARDSVSARLLRAELFLANQLYGEARHLLVELAEAAPGTPEVLQTLAELEVERGARREALALYRRLARSAADDPEVLFWLTELHLDLRRPDEALRWSRRMIALRPDLLQGLVELARTLERLGRAEEAAAAFSLLLDRFPSHPEALRAVAAYHHRHGETGQAFVLWRRALELAPHDADLRAYLAHLSPTEPSFEAPYRREASEVAAAGGGAPDAPIEVLLDQRVIRVFANGATHRFQAAVFAIRKPPADEESRTYRILFDPLRQRVEVLEAAVLGADGSRRELLTRRELRLSESWYGLYYDLHAVDLPFRELEAGDVLSVAFRVLDLEPGPRAGTFGDLTFVQGNAPRREMDYVVIVPADLPLDHRLVTPGGRPLDGRQEETVANGLRAVRYVLRDVPADALEPDAPGLAERAAYLHVSTFRSYTELGRFYARLAAGARRSSVDLRRLAREGSAAGESEAARVARLHRIVVDRIRYVGLEFGIHGIRPYDAPQVLSRRFGDCKDTATLLAVMLEEAGVASELALVRTRSLGHVPDQPASLAAFDHAILYVPSLDLWIDPTVRDAPPGVLSPAVQGTTALRIGREGGQLLRIPLAPPEADHAELDYRLTVREDGAAVLVADERWRGWRAAELRRVLRTPRFRARRLEERLATRHPGSSVANVQVEGLETLAPTLRLRFEAVLPALGTPEAVGLRLATNPLVPPLTTRISEALPAVRDGQRRAHTLEVPHRFQDTVRTRVTLPRGWTLAELPPAREVDRPVGRLAQSLARTPDGYEVTTSYAVRARRVSARKVEALARFGDTVDRVLETQLLVTPGGRAHAMGARAGRGERGRP